MKFSFLAIFAFVIAFQSHGQTDCLVQVANEPQKQISFRSPLSLDQDSSGQVWDIVGQQASIVIDGSQQSSQLVFSNLQALVPFGSIVTGVEARVTGQGGDGIQDLTVSLYNANGVIGENKANLASSGSPWSSTQSTWSYGGRYDTWGLDLSTQLVNAEDFGLILQVSNAGEVSTASIESVRIIVTYQEVYSVCPDHECVIFFIQNVSNYHSFDWHTPDGFINLDNDESDGIYSLGVGDAPDGYYDVCVDVVGSTGPESCCRTFRLGTCAASTIGDVVFNDVNQNGFQDVGEFGIPNVMVLLYDGNGNLVNAQVTDSNGSYLFANVESGDYRIEISGFGDYFPSYASSISPLYDGFSTDIFFLDFGETKLDVDLGLYKAYEVGGLVWLDSNCDGIYAETGSGISDLQVALFNIADDEVIAVTTDQDGVYDFGSVPEGSYYTVLSGYDNLLYAPTLLASDQLNGNSLFQDGGSAVSQTLILQDHTTQYLGLKTIYHSIAGSVWLDANCDGLNEGEDQLSELIVTLYNEIGEVIAETPSASDGSYSFDNLTYGNYSIGLSGFDTDIFTATLYNIGGNSLIAQSSGLYATDPIFITSDNIINLGLKRISYDISGFVWVDSNCDGVSNDPSIELPSMIVSLIDTNGNAVQATQTSSEGDYLFENVLIGDYSITILGFDSNLYQNTLIPIEGTLGQTNDLASTDTGVASTEVFTLSDTYQSYLGLKPILHEVSGVVWLDTNCNGIYDDQVSEVGPYGLTLVSTSGNMIATTVTEFDGSFVFQNIVYGEYTIHLDGVNPNLYESTLIPEVGTVGELNTLIGSSSESLFVADNTQVYLGLKQIFHKVSGKLWLDDNCDGFYSSGEVPIPGYQVNLINANNTIVQSLEVDAEGSYCFNNVTYGDYKISVEGYDDSVLVPTITPDPAGLDIPNTLTVQADGSFATDFELVNENTGIYLGFKTITYPILGFVWEDLNCDGMYIDSEPFLPGYTLELFDMLDQLVASTESTETGFDFGVQPVGEYYIKLIPIDNALTATFNPILQEGNSLNAINDLLLSEIFSIGPNTNIALGLKKTSGTLSGVTWYDIDGNGINDLSEPPLANVDIYLLSCEDNTYIDTVSTDEAGTYLFDDVATGSYYLLFEEPDTYVFSNYTTGSTENNNDIDGGNGIGTTSCFEVLPGENLTYDGGFTKYASIGDFVWADINSDGMQSTDELGLEGIQVELYTLDGTGVDTVLTNSNGNYSFDSILPGSYYVKVVLPEGGQFSVMTGVDQNLDSNISNQYGEGSTSAITLLAEDVNTTIDAGIMISLSSIAGAVWEDESANNVRDSSDQGLEDYVVSLISISGETLATTTTDQQGNYKFDQLFPGSYQVQFFIGEEYDFVNANVGAPEFNSDVVTEDGFTAIIDLGIQEDITGIDAGVFTAGMISGQLFIDVNANNIQDEEDSLAIEEMVAVSLIDAAAQEVVMTTVASNGEYAFVNVMPGFYFIRVDLIEGHIFSAFGEGFDDDIDFNIFSISDTYGETNSILITSNDFVDNVDVGFTPDTEFGQVGGRIFLDNYANGIQDDDPGMESVGIRLYSAGGVHINAGVTDANGDFIFNNVISGLYYIDFDVPEGYFLTDSEMSNDESIDSDFMMTDGFARSEPIVVVEDGAMYRVDGGLYQTASMGGEVWFDTNADGLQGIDEPLIDDYAITVGRGFGDNVATLNTVNGQYNLDDIKPGLYHIYVDLVDNYVFTQAHVGGDNTVDNDIANQYIDFGTTFNLFIKSGEERQHIDVGFIEKESIVISSITGNLFEDMNADGLNNDNAPLSDIVVRLIDVTNGIIIGESLTNSAGQYAFDEVLTGEYVVDIAPGQDWILSPLQVGSNDAIDSDFIEAPNSVYYEFEIGDTEEHLVADAGFYQFGSIGDQVWVDANENGIYDTDEVGIDGVTLYLVSNGDVVDDYVTDASGKYTFEDLLPGEYSIGSSIQEGYSYTEHSQGGLEVDSDIILVSGLSGSTSAIQINSREHNTTIDIGIVKEEVVILESAIEGLVWDDLNGNGILEAGEPQLNDVSVFLYSSDDQLVDISETGDTGTDGRYRFEITSPGEYYIVFDADSAGDLVTTPNASADELLDSDVTGELREYATDLITVNEGAELRGVNLGVISYGQIGDIAWIDENENGQYESDEAGAQGVVITLFYNNSMLDTYTTTTTTTGRYLFDDLLPGDYRIATAIPSGTFYSDSGQGDETVDSDILLASGLSGTTDIITIKSGESNLNVDIGVIEEEVVVIPGSVRGVVWEDLNANGIYEIGEPRINDVTVYLYDAANNLVDITETGDTGVEGIYAFDVESFGSHYVIFEGDGLADVITASNIASDDLVDSDVTGDFDQFSTSLFEITEGDIVDGLNLGLYDYAKLGDFAWLDSNEDGLQQFGEEGINGIRVSLFDSEGQFVGQKFTVSLNGNDGYYLFDELKPGDYRIEVNLNAGLEFTSGKVGGDADFDSDIIDGTNSSDMITLHSGEENMSTDIGFSTMPGQLGDFVWIDTNGDGVQSPGEVGLNGVQVELFDNSHNLILSTMTSSLNGEPGYYVFDNVFTGSYYIKFSLPGDYVFVRANSGNNDGLDSDVSSNISLGTTDIFSLSSGIQDVDVDAGVYLPSSIGDYVWYDENKNGIQDMTEQGVGLVVVNLYHTQFGFVGSTLTDSNGRYAFEDLPSGSYYIDIDLPDDLQFTLQKQGSNGEVDSDVSGNGISSTFTVGYNEAVVDLDAGVYKTSGLVGDYIWHDSNANGQQDFDEVGMAGVAITLMSTALDPVRDMVSDAMGNYIFDDLVPGNYRLHVEAPSGFLHSEQGVGFVDEEDSDFDQDGMSDVLYLDADNSRRNIDAGLFQFGQLITPVWVDANEDGINNDPMVDFDQMTVHLFDKQSNAVAASTEIFSQGGGQFVQFDNVKPGEYYLVFKTSQFEKETSRSQGSNPMLDSDVFMFAGELMTDVFQITSGQVKQDIAAGFILEEKQVSADIYPNPTTDAIQVQFSNMIKKVDQVYIELYNATGQLVYSEHTTDTDSNYTIDLKGFDAAVYQLYIYANGHRFAKQIIKLD